MFLGQFLISATNWHYSGGEHDFTLFTYHYSVMYLGTPRQSWLGSVGDDQPDKL